jgi:hypothetical protein
VTTQYQQGKLNEKSISGYARARKIEEITIGLSLMCALPEDAVERALASESREMLLIMARALRFSWETTMSLLFLGARDHRIASRELKGLEGEFRRLNIETSRDLLKSYRSHNGHANPAGELQPALVAR